MKDSYVDGKITLNENISPNIYKLKLRGNFKGKPGQFYMVKGWNGEDPFLPRPISISNLEDGELTLLYEVRGRGTHIISDLKPGDKLSLLGPLGQGFELRDEKKVALVAGGIGIAPLLYLAKELNCKIDLYSGFREDVYYTEEFKDYVEEINISTEDGSRGHKGYITEILKPEEYDLVISCGPEAMMMSVIDVCKGKTDVEISMENRMACGIGACMGCTIETVRGMERVCKEGPVFKAEEVVFQ